MKTLSYILYAFIILHFIVALTEAQATTINVNAPGGGGCDDLVDAINSASTDSSVGTCTAGSGADIIELAASSIYMLAVSNNDTNVFGNNGLPVITTTITVNGNNATIFLL